MQSVIKEEKLNQEFTNTELDLIVDLAKVEFSLFPPLVSGNKNPEHIHYIAEKIQKAIESPLLESDKNKLLIISIPPRHGKTELISKHFPAWILGNYPEKRIILSSYGAELAESNSDTAKSIFEQWGPLLWNVHPGEIFKRSAWNTDKKGGVRAAGIGGPITGFGADLFIIDDYIKDHEEAESEVQREKVWNWWQSVASTRLHPGAVVIILATRWHYDDLIGRLLDQKENEKEEFPFELEYINLPALAQENDLLDRETGKALWPWRFNENRLQNIKKTSGSYWWSALYGGSPTPREGLMFKCENFEIVNEVPKNKIIKSVRYWDKAGTQDGGACTAGILMHFLSNGRFLISDVTKGQWSSGNREKKIKQTAKIDGYDVIQYFEQEPGSGGKESAENTVRNLRGYRAHADKVTGSKELRADPYSAQVEIGNVQVLRRPWTRVFIEEHRTFPKGKFRDQVDAAAGAFNKLVGKRKKAGAWGSD